MLPLFPLRSTHTGIFVASSVRRWRKVFLLAKGKKIRGSFKEEEKYCGETIIVSVSAAESSGLLGRGGR